MNNQSDVNIVIAFLSGVTATSVAFLIISFLYPSNISHQLVNECENTLPRNQSCVIIAVPESEIFGE